MILLIHILVILSDAYEKINNKRLIIMQNEDKTVGFFEDVVVVFGVGDDGLMFDRISF